MPEIRFFMIVPTEQNFRGKALLTASEAETVAFFMAKRDRPPHGAGSTIFTKEDDQFLLLGSILSLKTWEKVVRGTHQYDGPKVRQAIRG